MTSTPRALSWAWLAALVGCGGSPPPPSAPAAAKPAADEPMPMEGVLLGQWTGDKGALYLRQDPDGTVRGVYSHRAGAVVGRIKGGVFRGWWCEAPTREPDDDAGDVELIFARDPEGLMIDGRWRHGASDSWRDDWDLLWSEGPVDPVLMASFGDESRFCAKP